MALAFNPTEGRHPSNLLATAPPMNPEDPNTVTTSPEKDDRPPRPLFIAAVLSSRGRTSLA